MSEMNYNSENIHFRRMECSEEFSTDMYHIYNVETDKSAEIELFDDYMVFYSRNEGFYEYYTNVELLLIRAIVYVSDIESEDTYSREKVVKEFEGFAVTCGSNDVDCRDGYCIDDKNLQWHFYWDTQGDPLLPNVLKRCYCNDRVNCNRK